MTAERGVKVFNVIPENFFIPLSAPNKFIYWDCILRLFSVMDNQLSFGIERELLVDELQYYFENESRFELNKEEGESTDTKNSRDKANWVLRRLEHYNWIEIETDKNYVQRVNFKDYAVKIITTLIGIKEKKQIEYQGYVYTICSILNDNRYSPGTQLLSIKDNTEQLITGLKNLNSSIKQYINGLASHDAENILSTLFDDYMVNIVDKAYHRLITSDNVSRYRPEIIDRLESKANNHIFIDEAAKEIAEIESITYAQAKEEVYDLINSIVSAFRNLNNIIEEINKKNMQYQKAAVNRVKFSLVGKGDVRGQIKEIIYYINEIALKENLSLNEECDIDFFSDMIKIYSTSFIDEKSLRTPVEDKKEFKPEPLKHKVIDRQKRKNDTKAFKDKIKAELSQNKINEYVLSNLKGKNEMLASELPFNSINEYIYMIYVRLFAGKKESNYYVEPLNQEVSINNFRFNNFIIKRRM